MPRFPEPGTVLLGKYRVTSLIGEGGMGVVIRAKHIELDEDVAIKCLLPEMLERPDIVQRFLREAKAAVKLKGEHVARVHDVGRLDTQVPFIVMEYLEGADLNAILKHHGAQEPMVAVDLMLQACEAIAEAHSLGIVHRDIKASNFFITQPDNEAPILKVLDFGIATAPEGTSDLTSTQSVIGTPAYMSPEMMRSSKTSDSRSDIWSMGVVLYELLEGQRPFRSEVYSELCLKVGMDPPHPITNAEVPDGLRAVVIKCLEKPLEKRYQSVAELAFDLMPYASDPSLARRAVESCARLLGRRATKMFEAAAMRSEDTTPVPKVPYRITPTSGQMAAAHPDDMSDASSRSPAPSGRLTGLTGSSSSVLGRPTPIPTTKSNTPTSIGGSNGEVASAVLPEYKPRRRGLLIGLTSATLVAAGIVAMLAFGGRGGGSTSTAAQQPESDVPATEPIKLEPVTDEPQAVESAKAEPAKAEPAKAEPEKVEPTKIEPAKVEPTTVAAPTKVDAQKVAAQKVAVPVKQPIKKAAAKVVKRVAVKKAPLKKDPAKKDPVKDPKDEPGGELFQKRE
jgi:serine/threonine-protein kinase